MKTLVVILLFLQSLNCISQNADTTINNKRLYSLIAFEATSYTGIIIGLNQLWYKGYDRSSFHFFNDGDEWLQVDKLGHLQSAYHTNSIVSNAFKWSGINNKKSILYGAGVAWTYILTIEIFDGLSKKWGASVYDVAANTAGILLYSGQELCWNKRMIIPKGSIHTTKYREERPDALGKNNIEGLIKDYNGQTHWLGFNLLELAKKKEKSPFLLSIGYGATGMVGGTTNYNHPLYPDSKRVRQYYLSLDLDLSRISTKSKFLNSALRVLNIFKIPFPTLELSEGKVRGHLVYF